MATKKKAPPTGKVETTTSLPYVICRCKDAGVHAGELQGERDGRVTLLNARRVWYWQGAASLSEIAEKGAGESSKIAVVVTRVDLRSDDVAEIIYCQKAGADWLRGIKPWRA